MKPKVSIIIPVYNVEKYILKCIESVINQKDFNRFEVIIIDDGTLDNSIGVIKEIIKDFPNIMVIRQENKGLSEARNTGLKYVTGEYISFVDSDDWIEPEMISTLYENAIKTKSNIAICNIRKVYLEDSMRLEYMNSGFNNGAIISSKKAIEYFFEHKKLTGHVCNKIFKKELFDQYNIKFPINKKYEDMPACFELIWYSNQVIFINENFYNYVQRGDSITGHSTEDLWDVIENLYYMKNFLIEKNNYKIYRQQILHLLILKMFDVYSYLRKNKDSKEYFLLSEKMMKELKDINVSGIMMASKIKPIVKIKYLTMKFRCYYIWDFLVFLNCTLSYYKFKKYKKKNIVA